MARIREAAHLAGADGVVDRLGNGYDTLLGTWLVDGTELSEGEWRRIALARTLLRPAQVVILDEPTSAMDPWAEIQWIQRLQKFATGKTVILITHRFTTALHADIIYVMDEGRVIESGSHSELIAQNGRYAQSWAEQLRNPLS